MDADKEKFGRGKGGKDGPARDDRFFRPFRVLMPIRVHPRASASKISSRAAGVDLPAGRRRSLGSPASRRQPRNSQNIGHEWHELHESENAIRVIGAIRDQYEEEWDADARG